MSLGVSLAQAAPLYNIGFAVISILLFIKLFTSPVRDKRVYLMPWKILFFAVLIVIVEAILTILRAADILNIPRHINGFFELAIICLFIYALLLQKEHVKLLGK